MKRLYILIPTVIISIELFVTLVLQRQESDGFFYLCNGYVAVPINEALDVSFTYFYEKKPMIFSDIIKIEFSDSKSINIDAYEIYVMERDKKFKSYGITLKLSFNEYGIDEVDSLLFTYSDGHTDTYPVGAWVFDIDEADCGLIDTWASPALSAIAPQFAYSYTLLKKDSVVNGLQVGKHTYTTVSNNSNNIEGKVDIISDAPMNYIKAKILLNYDDNGLIAYGKGCYCGALDVSEESIILSKERNK